MDNSGRKLSVTLQAQGDAKVTQCVSHFSLDTEGCGHTPYKDTFFQLGVWYTDGTCEVYMG